MPVIIGLPGPDVWPLVERGEVILGGCVVDTVMPNGASPVECVNEDWSGAIRNGELLSHVWLAGFAQLQAFEAVWDDESFTIDDFMRIGDLLTEAQQTHRDDTIAVLGPPALEALTRRFGTMNDAYHHIGWYVGEMYYFADDVRGLPVLKRTAQALAALDHPGCETRMDVLAQLGWLAAHAGKNRVSYRAYAERHRWLDEIYGADDPEVIEARQLARTAAERAGFSRAADRLS